MLERVRIVLHQPTGPANVGAVCRAMANMGLSDLVLVSPKYPTDHEQSVAYATHGVHVLESARVVDTLEEALADCVRTYATSAKLGLYRRQAAIPPNEASREAIDLTPKGSVAFAFGPENYGFRTRELLMFDRIVSIPAHADYPVLNLAAAVMIVVYEVHRAWLAVAGDGPLPMALDGDIAPDQRKQILFTKLFDALDRIGFFSEQSPDKLKYALRHLLGRVEMSVHEADIMIGMAQQIRWYADKHPPSS
ncbi:MAG: RNA methyltransferase [Phycisphaerae bacterium]|nr:RNA methyltransferase [Phycisphaerae bacterium]